jgi:hypothetical protein
MYGAPRLKGSGKPRALLIISQLNFADVRRASENFRLQIGGDDFWKA